MNRRKLWAFITKTIATSYCARTNIHEEKGSTQMTMRSFFRGLYRCLPAAPSTNYLYRRFKPSPYDFLPQQATIYDIGAKSAAGRYAFGVPPSDARVVTIDLFAGPGVDVVADAHDLGLLPASSADCVLIVSVLEYCHTPQQVVAQAYRLLKPGGTLYIGAAFLLKLSPDPIDYYRFSVHALRHLCRDFEIVDSGSNRGPASTMCDLNVHYLAMLFCFGSSAVYRLLTYTLRWLLFWTKYADAIIARYSLAAVLQGTAYVIARKKSGEGAP